MASIHENIVNQIIMDWSKSGRGRLFKNHVGTAWWGKVLNTSSKNAIMIEYPKKITYGLPVGSSDLIGWELIEYEMQAECYTPCFCSIEVKTKAAPKLTDEQKLWLMNIVNIGGRAYVARETDGGYDLEAWNINDNPL